MDKETKLKELVRREAQDRNRALDTDEAHFVKARWDRIQHPLHSLGLLEDALVQIAGLTQDTSIRLDRKAVVVFCADNGVTEEKVTQTDSSVTGIVARCIVQGRTSVCRMALTAGAEVIPVDMGIKDFPGMPGVLDRRIGNGTASILHGPAMSRGDAVRAIWAGFELAGALKERGYSLLGVGEMGIGNTTTSSACACALLGRDPAEMTGKGAGLSDQGLLHKVDVVRGALQKNDLGPDASASCAADPVEVLRRVGGFDLLGMCGLYLGGWMYRIPLLMDGFASSVAAAAAAMICPDAKDAMLASHLSAEPAAGLILSLLGKQPLIAGGLHMGEGTGAVLAMPMLDMALAAYRDSYTFEEGGVEAYQPL